MGFLDFLKRIPTQSEIIGGMGEWLTKTYAKTIPDALVLHDVLIDGADQKTSQIDLLIIGNKGIYIIEVKTFSNAKIYGDAQKSKWYYYSHGKKFDIYSPIKQNKKHVEYMKAFLKDFGDVPCFSLVTMICDDFKIEGKFDPDTVICNSFSSMERALYKLGENKPEIWTDEQKQQVFEYIRNNQYIGKEARREHKETVISYKQDLEKMQEKKICPYCKINLVLRNGKYGEFYGCPNYPKCKYVLKNK